MAVPRRRRRPPTADAAADRAAVAAPARRALAPLARRGPRAPGGRRRARHADRDRARAVGAARRAVHRAAARGGAVRGLRRRRRRRWRPTCGPSSRSWSASRRSSQSERGQARSTSRRVSSTSSAASVSWSTSWSTVGSATSSSGERPRRSAGRRPSPARASQSSSDSPGARGPIAVPRRTSSFRVKVRGERARHRDHDVLHVAALHREHERRLGEDDAGSSAGADVVVEVEAEPSRRRRSCPAWRARSVAAVPSERTVASTPRPLELATQDRRAER